MQVINLFSCCQSSLQKVIVNCCLCIGPDSLIKQIIIGIHPHKRVLSSFLRCHPHGDPKLHAEMRQASDALDMEVFLADGEKIGAQELDFFLELVTGMTGLEPRRTCWFCQTRSFLMQSQSWGMQTRCSPSSAALQDNHTLESILMEQSCGVPVQGNVRGARNKSA